MAKHATIDAYLASLPDDQRVALEKVRKAIRAAAPKAEECFSYGLPAFRGEGGLLAGLGASAKHCAYYPMSGSVVGAFANELKGYDTSKGTIRFAAAKPLPATLVRKLVRARQAETAVAPTKRPAKKTAPSPASRADLGVTAYLRELDHPLEKEIQAVRRIILGVSPEIGEGMKWNAPSFFTSQGYFATLNVRSHESTDRCLLTLGKGGAIAKNRAAFTAIIRAWVKHV